MKDCTYFTCVTNLCNLIASRDINVVKIHMIKKKKTKQLAEAPPLNLIMKAKSGTGKQNYGYKSCYFFY